MTVWIALVAGILIGWIIEWIIDWRYWRRNVAGFYATETQLRNQLAASEAQLAELTAANAALQTEVETTRTGEDVLSPPVPEPEDSTTSETEDVAAGSDNESVLDAQDEAEPVPEQAADDAATSAALAAVSAALADSTPEPAPDPDDLTKVSGIGPVYRRKLHDAGIYSFAQLAASSSEELNAAIAPAGFQKPDYDQWVTDAGTLVYETSASGTED